MKFPVQRSNLMTNSRLHCLPRLCSLREARLRLWFNSFIDCSRNMSWKASIPLHPPLPIPGLFLAVAYRGCQNPSGEAWEQLEPSMLSLTALELPASCKKNSFHNAWARNVLDKTLHFKKFSVNCSLIKRSNNMKTPIQASHLPKDNVI